MESNFITIVMHPGWVKTRMGGAGAPVEPKDSVAGMIEVIDALNTEDNGAFLDYHGNTIPW